MDLNVGTVINSAMTIGSAVPDSSNDTGKASLKNFLYAMSKYGIQIKSNFEVTYDGLVGLQFFIQSINVPGLKSNNGTIHYKGREIQVPGNYEQQHDVTMTVINDQTGFLYQTLRKLMIIDYESQLIYNSYSMTVRALGDQNNFSGTVFVMNGIRITEVSGLEFGHTDNSVQTFTVNLTVSKMQIQQTRIKTDNGILGKIGGAADMVNSAASKLFGV